MAMEIGGGWMDGAVKGKEGKGREGRLRYEIELGGVLKLRMGDFGGGRLLSVSVSVLAFFYYARV